MKNKNNREIFRNLSFVLQIGLTVIVPTLLLTALGIFIDKKSGMYFTIPLCILGMAGGITGVWKMIKKTDALKDEPKETYDLMAGWHEEEKSENKEE